MIQVLGSLKQVRGGEQQFFDLRDQEKEIEDLIYTQVLVGTSSIDFSEKGNETQLIYSGLVLLDQPSQGFNQFTKMTK